MRLPASAGSIVAALAFALGCLAPFAPARAQAPAADPTDAKLKSMIGKQRAAKKKDSAGAAQTTPVAIGNAKDEEAPPPAEPARPDPREADLALLRALGYAFEPAPREIRVIAIEDLALLNDDRALNPLAHLIVDPDPLIALAAVRTVTHFQHPRAEEILANVIRHPTLSNTLKVAAVRGLPFQDSPSSRELLTEIANTTSFPAPVRQAARAAIAEMAPAAAAAINSQR